MADNDAQRLNRIAATIKDNPVPDDTPEKLEEKRLRSKKLSIPVGFVLSLVWVNSMLI